MANGKNNQNKKSFTGPRGTLAGQTRALSGQLKKATRKLKTINQNRNAANKRASQKGNRSAGGIYRGSSDSEAVANYMASVLDPVNAPVPSRIPNDFPKESALKRLNYNHVFNANAEGNFAVVWKPWDLVGGCAIYSDDTLVTGTMTQEQPCVYPPRLQITDKFERQYWSHAVLVGASLRIKSNGPAGSTQGYMVCSNMPVTVPSETQAFTENNLKSIGITSRFEPYGSPEMIYYPRDPNDICFRTKAEFDDGSDMSECTLTAIGLGLVNALTDKPVQLEIELCIIVEYVPELGFEMAELGKAKVDSRAIPAMSSLASRRRDFAVAKAEPNGNWATRLISGVRKVAASAPAQILGDIAHNLWDSGLLPKLGGAMMAMV